MIVLYFIGSLIFYSHDLRIALLEIGDCESTENI